MLVDESHCLLAFPGKSKYKLVFRILNIHRCEYFLCEYIHYSQVIKKTYELDIFFHNCDRPQEKGGCERDQNNHNY